MHVMLLQKKNYLQLHHRFSKKMLTVPPTMHDKVVPLTRILVSAITLTSGTVTLRLQVRTPLHGGGVPPEMEEESLLKQLLILSSCNALLANENLSDCAGVSS